MATKQTTDNSGVILEKILEVKKLVDQSLELSRETAGSLRNLRTELGVDGAHGRLPQLEEQYARLDRRQEVDNKEVCRMIAEASSKSHEDKNKLIARISQLELSNSQARGGGWVINRLLDFATSSVAAGIILAIAKALGWIH